jgi:hypothetical protein
MACQSYDRNTSNSLPLSEADILPCLLRTSFVSFSIVSRQVFVSLSWLTCSNSFLPHSLQPGSAFDTDHRDIGPSAATRHKGSLCTTLSHTRQQPERQSSLKIPWKRRSLRDPSRGAPRYITRKLTFPVLGFRNAVFHPQLSRICQRRAGKYCAESHMSCYVRLQSSYACVVPRMVIRSCEVGMA